MVKIWNDICNFEYITLDHTYYTEKTLPCKTIAYLMEKLKNCKK